MKLRARALMNFTGAVQPAYIHPSTNGEISRLDSLMS